MPSISATVSLRGVIRQAEDHEVHFLHQRALGAGILALVLGDALDHDVVLRAEALANAEAGGSGRAVDEHGGLRGGAGQGLAFRLLGVGEGHGAFLQSADALTGAGDL